MRRVIINILEISVAICSALAGLALTSEVI